MAGPLDGGSRWPGNVVRVVIEPQAYKNVCYLVIALPLAIVFTAPLTVLFAFGLLFAPLGVGLGLLVATLLLARLLAGLERRVANALLGLAVTAPEPPPHREGRLAAVRRYLEAPSTWRGLGFVLLKFWVGLLGLALLVLGVGAIELLSVPLDYPTVVRFGAVNEQPIRWAIDTPLEVGLAVPAGLGLGLGTLHLANGFAYAVRASASALLSAPGAAEVPAQSDE